MIFCVAGGRGRPCRQVIIAFGAVDDPGGVEAGFIGSVGNRIRAVGGSPKDLTEQWQRVDGEMRYRADRILGPGGGPFETSLPR